MNLHCNGSVKLVYLLTPFCMCLESSECSHWAWNCLVAIRRRPPSCRPTSAVGVWAPKPWTIMPKVLLLRLHCSLRHALLAPTWEQKYSILLLCLTRLQAFTGLVHSWMRLRSCVKLSTSFLCASTFLFKRFPHLPPHTAHIHQCGEKKRKQKGAIAVIVPFVWL